MYSTTIKRSTATAIAAVALAAAVGAPASAGIPDRVPAAGLPDMHASTAIAAAEARRAQDLRSPDARDATEGRGTFSAPEVTVVKVPQTTPLAGGGLDLGDAVIGAGGALAVILLASGGAFAVSHRRRGAGVAPTV